MISLTRLSGSVFALNADLIERIDSTPDTVITLVDGKKYVVAEPLRDVMSAILRHRAEVVALSSQIQVADLRLPRDPYDPRDPHAAGPDQQALASLLDLHQPRPSLSVVDGEHPDVATATVSGEVSPR
jgi:flagellar protein FlbD